MSRRSFRSKFFLALFLASMLPVALMLGTGWLLVTNSPGYLGTKAQIDSLKQSWKPVDSLIQVQPHSAELDLAMQIHTHRVERFVELATNAIYRFRNEYLPVALLCFAIAIVAGWLATWLTGRWLTPQLSTPLERLVDWTGRIRRHESLPVADPSGDGTSREFVALEEALREMQRDLNQARSAEIEAERLRAFGEVARRVAHEMKNPLTPIRLAVSQMSRTATPENREMLDVIAAESGRLEAMAREFAQLGRLPDGVIAPVDLRELLDELMHSTLPEGMTRQFESGDDVGAIDGYYDPLRRAFSNLFRNAVEACAGNGRIAVTLRRQHGGIEITIADTGPGIPVDRREKIFQPYFTDKGDGTGLGLAIVRQTIEQHHGTISVSDTPGGGATFLVRFPT